MKLEHLKLGLRLGLIDRFGVHPIIGSRQKVDQHSFRAALLYIYLGGKEIVPALLHDAEEAVTGDIPSPVKKDTPGVRKWEALRPGFEDKNEKDLFKLADDLDALLIVIEQRKLGNSLLEDLYTNIKADVFERASRLGKTMRLYEVIDG